MELNNLKDKDDSAVGKFYVKFVVKFYIKKEQNYCSFSISLIKSNLPYINCRG
jgi:hypothetical protein